MNVNLIKSRKGRREFLIATTATIATIAIGCGDKESTNPSPDDIGSDILESDAGTNDSSQDTNINSQFMWNTIPALIFTVGIPVDLDLRLYLTDSTNAAMITAEMQLPDGLSFENGKITGVPSSSTDANITFFADDGLDG